MDTDACREAIAAAFRACAANNRVVLVPHKGVGKARPRVVRSGKKTWSFMPKDYQVFRDIVAHYARPLKLNEYAATKPTLTMIFAFGIPLPKLITRQVMESTGLEFKRGQTDAERRAMLNGKDCPIRPDVDNLIGAIMDSCLETDDKVSRVLGERVWHDGEGYSMFGIM